VQGFTTSVFRLKGFTGHRYLRLKCFTDLGIIWLKGFTGSLFYEVQASLVL
jgi:hypothetical protein